MTLGLTSLGSAPQLVFLILFPRIQQILRDFRVPQTHSPIPKSGSPPQPHNCRPATGLLPMKPDHEFCATAERSRRLHAIQRPEAHNTQELPRACSLRYAREDRSDVREVPAYSISRFSPSIESRMTVYSGTPM